MQRDGNFVIYNGFSLRASFSTHMEGHGGAFIVLQDDGNLVIYDANGPPTYWWASFEHPS